MDIENMFDFLQKEYGLSYKQQEFKNCYGGNWVVHTHSFYNDSGCFTIYIEFQRGIDFWYAPQFSTERKVLCGKEVDIRLIEPEIWDRYEKIWIFKRPFFWWNNKKILKTFALALRAHLEKNNDFFGLKIKRTLS